MAATLTERVLTQIVGASSPVASAVTELPFDSCVPPGILLDDRAEGSGRDRAAVLADSTASTPTG
jgi:hypothetical protein